MRVVRYTDQIEEAARLYGRSVEDQRRRDDDQGQPLQRWIAIDGGSVIGAATTWLRPDDRMFLMIAYDGPRAIEPLSHTVAAELDRSVSTLADYDDLELMAALENAGFRIEMVSEGFRLRFDQVMPILERTKAPSGFSIRSAIHVDEDRLFDLDNAIRNDVSGTDGWKGDRAWFHDELTESPPFDASAYLVAIHDADDDYAGLVRVWRNPNGPRLGLVGVLSRYRSTTIAAVLLRDALQAASSWGFDSFVTETSLENRVLHPRMRRYGADSTGRFAQLIRP